MFNDVFSCPFTRRMFRQEACCRTGVRIPPIRSCFRRSALRRIRRPIALNLHVVRPPAGLPQLDHAAVGENTAKVYAGVIMQSRPYDRAGIDHCVTTDFRAIANDRAEFSEACWNVSIGRYDRDFAVIELYVGKDHAGAQMRVMADDRITHVIEVRHLHFIEQD